MTSRRVPALASLAQAGTEPAGNGVRRECELPLSMRVDSGASNLRSAH